MAATLSSLLPAPVHVEESAPSTSSKKQERELTAKSAQLSLVSQRSKAPPYGSRKGWMPTKQEDYGDGGAYPECHRAQYPLELGRKRTTNSNTLPLQVNEDGKIRYEAIAQQGHREGRHVQASFKALVPLAKRTDVKNAEMERPSEDEVANTTARTQAALQKLLNGKIKAANPKNVPSSVANTNYVRYTPNDDSKQRLIKMVDVVEDPLEPPRFKAKKIPRGPPSPPAPIMRSPPRKVTAQDQKDWMIPPCVSNWKNNKGYTIPLDKRLAADGRGLQDVHINDRFAQFSESLYVADRHAREEVRQRAQLQQRIAEKQKEDKEEHLRLLAQRARDERAGIVAPSTSGGASRLSGAPGGATVSYGTDDEESDGGEVAPRRSGERGDTPEERRAAKERDLMRRERRQERERELRMSNMGTETRARVLARAQNRDISEKVALGLAKPTLSKESMLDSRLFNQEQLSHSFGDDDSYNLYDRPLFSGAAAAAAIYRRGQVGDDADEGLAGTAEGIESSMKNDRFGLGQSKFEGSDLQSVREGPVQFEKDTPMTSSNAAADPFGVNAFLDEAKKAAPKKHGLDTRDDRPGKRARD
ncbi:hypothetical protein P389DRAFT_163221 [Cystobasidium minutum MCA 4210]|uniref:uncharacterized protein n=1 Tax=Cystobasidium minutum MCA 4210 TaxID=1397322 RepID=UPI0034CE1EF7|eukprot:jgi/Rhomi1/163221/estExt_Genewise1Plus.C_7_t10260